MPECEAERRIKQTLYVMENDWGAGVFDYAKIRGILTGWGLKTCACEPGQGDLRISAAGS